MNIYKETKTYLIDGNEAFAYNVHYEKNNEWLSKIDFSVYPVVLWENLIGEEGIGYKNKKDDGFLKEFDDKKVLMKFQGSVCWRGDWEVRIYFTDDEYWGSELEIMSKLLKDIKSYCKNKLRADKS